MKQGSYLPQYQDSVPFVKHNRSIQKCTVLSQTVTRPINFEIKLLELDEMEGKSINLLVSICTVK